MFVGGGAQRSREPESPASPAIAPVVAAPVATAAPSTGARALPVAPAVIEMAGDDDDVGERANRERVVAGDPAAVPTLRGQVFEESQNRKRTPKDGSKGPGEHVIDHDAVVCRRPQRTTMEEATIAGPTVMKPTVTMRSCQG